MLQFGSKDITFRRNLFQVSKGVSSTIIAAPMFDYCAFHKHANSKVQKPTDDCVFNVAVNHLNGSLRKQNFTLTGSKGHGF